MMPNSRRRQTLILDAIDDAPLAIIRAFCRLMFADIFTWRYDAKLGNVVARLRSRRKRRVRLGGAAVLGRYLY
jgi:hypothetical protein